MVHDAMRKALAVVSLISAGSAAVAVPQLQLGIVGATYDLGTETSVASTNPFTLYAFLTPQLSGNPADRPAQLAALLADTYYVSASVLPQQVPPGASLGSFTFGGATISVTGGMSYGTPPLDAVYGAVYGDLQTHSVFPTYFSEFSLTSFAGAARFDELNTQDFPTLATLTPNAAGTMYGIPINVDVSALTAGYSIHFDLYSTDVRNCVGQEQCSTVVSRDDFAPFSHDAQSGSSSTGGQSSTGGSSTTGGQSSSGNVPEPGSAPLVGLGLMILSAGYWARRRRLGQR